jgi:hypothetical protein
MKNNLLHLVIGGVLGAISTLLFKQPNIGIAIGTAFGFIRQIQDIESKGTRAFLEFISAILGAVLGSLLVSTLYK